MRQVVVMGDGELLREACLHFLFSGYLSTLRVLGRGNRYLGEFHWRLALYTSTTSSRMEDR